MSRSTEQHLRPWILHMKAIKKESPLSSCAESIVEAILPILRDTLYIVYESRFSLSFFFLCESAAHRCSSAHSLVTGSSRMMDRTKWIRDILHALRQIRCIFLPALSRSLFRDPFSANYASEISSLAPWAVSNQRSRGDSQW